MAKKSGSNYTTIAKDMPCSDYKGAGADAWKVVGGQPADQKTSKNGPGEEKNTGKTRQY